MTEPKPAITDAELDEFSELEKRATPGPWLVRPKEDDDWGVVRACDWMVASAKAGRYTSEAEISEHRQNGTDPYGHNAEFIAAARNISPRLVERVREQDAIIYVTVQIDKDTWANLPKVEGKGTKTDD